MADIYLFPERVCLSLLSGGKWSACFCFEVACEMICPVRSEELHLLMAAHVFFFVVVVKWCVLQHSGFVRLKESKMC